MLKNRGITLIALIITIIILLILAGVTIGALTGDNDLINQAGEAKEKSEIENEKEIVETSTIQAMGKDKYGDVKKSDLEEKLNTNAGEGKTQVTEDGNQLVVKFNESNRYYTVDSNGNVEIFEIIEDKTPGDITKDENGNTLKGTEEEPYEIWSIEDLVAFSKSVNNGINYAGQYISLKKTLDFASIFSYSDYTTKEYDVYLGGDGTVDLKTQLSSEGYGFKTIAGTINGNYQIFRGTFDGENNEILNLYMKDSAFFSNIENATIKNLKIDGEITGEAYAGMIQKATDSYIINCTNYADLTGQLVGGICINSTNSYFYNCCNSGKISAKWQSGAGGIVATANNGTQIYNSYNLAEVSLVNGTSYASSGGIIGIARENSSKITIENCYNIGNITSSVYAGGIIGSFSGDEITVNNCYFLNNENNGCGNQSNVGIQLTREQLQNKELIEGKYILDIFNEFANNYNNQQPTIRLNNWKVDEGTNYLTFEYK